MSQGISSLLDLETYPIDRPGSAEHAKLVKDCKTALQMDGNVQSCRFHEGRRYGTRGCRFETGLGTTPASRMNATITSTSRTKYPACPRTIQP